MHALLVLIWNDELGAARGICEAVLSAARQRGSMSLVAHASCLRSMIMRRLGQLDAAADDAMLALEFKLATSPPPRGPPPWARPRGRTLPPRPEYS